MTIRRIPFTIRRGESLDVYLGLGRDEPTISIEHHGNGWHVYIFPTHNDGNHIGPVAICNDGQVLYRPDQPHPARALEIIKHEEALPTEQ